MRKSYIYFILATIVISMGAVSCGKDRSGEYYALISNKTWMYNVMQEYYLFYEDLPAEEELDFFKKPSDFLRTVASSRDQKNGVIFSHIDSVFTTRSQSQYPSFGFEGALVRNAEGNNVVHVLYTYPNSPAEEVNLKRGEWILLADSQQISSSNFERFISRPVKSHRFQIARKNAEGKPDTVFVDMPQPRIVKEPSVLATRTVKVGNKEAYYIAYNLFNKESENELQDAFAQMPASATNVILDLRYNPGGNVSTAVMLSTYLAPQEAMNQKCVDLIQNDKQNKTLSFQFDPTLLNGAQPVQFEHLYVLTTANTASASELVINCLRPYLGQKLLQVGEPTFGKNVAQSLFTDEEVKQLEFWLTTAFVSNSKGEYDYYEKGLLPDYLISEDLSKELGELGTPQDSLLRPVLYHMEHGQFPSLPKPETQTSRSYGIGKVIYNPVSHKPKRTLFVP